MDIKKKILLSLAEWKEISSGLELSPNDLSMITSGLRLLTKSQLELATLARTQHLEDNLADSLAGTMRLKNSHRLEAVGNEKDPT